jgi:hypothetical protein
MFFGPCTESGVDGFTVTIAMPLTSPDNDPHTFASLTDNTVYVVDTVGDTGTLNVVVDDVNPIVAVPLE